MEYFIKIIGAGLIVFVTTSYGFLRCKELNIRLAELKELVKIVFLLKGEIEYGHTPMPEAFNNISKRCHTSLKDIFGDFSLQIQSTNSQFSVTWKEYMKENLSKTKLSKYEKEELLSLGETLGLSECKTQINALNNYEKELNTSIEELNRQMPSKTKVYKSLGVTSGVIITIIIV